jgi:Eukaryotic aspartyl protease
MLTSAILILATTIFNLQAEASAVSTSPVPSTQTIRSLTLSPHVLNLKRKSSADGSKLRRRAVNLRNDAIPVSSHSTSLVSLFQGQLFVTEVTFGTETFELVVDTGSSDTWVIETGFSCFSVPAGSPIPQAKCLFGPSYNVTKTFEQVKSENFNLTYYSGEFLAGIIGTEDVTLAGIKVEKQTVALVNKAAWLGDGTSSGLLGLAYPAL